MDRDPTKEPQLRAPADGDQKISRGPELRLCGPAMNVDKRAIYALLEAINILYSLLEIVCNAKLPDAAPQAALMKMVVALAALTASEAEALVILLQFDQFPASRIHLRSLGEHALHVAAFMRDPLLAQKAYEATHASVRELVGKMTLVSEPLKNQILAQGAASNSVKPMQRILQTAMKQLGQPSDPAELFQRSWLSKWNHGDAVALKEVADRLKNGEGDLRARISLTPEGEADAILGIHSITGVLKALHALTGTPSKPTDDLSAYNNWLVGEFEHLLPPEPESP